jgi:tetratricopeptide (TPR) repeat protein
MIYLFQTTMVALFGAFFSLGVLSLPFFQEKSSEVPFTLQFDSAEADLWEANRAYNQALQSDDELLRVAALKQAEAQIPQSLEGRPMNPHAWSLWARIAYLRGKDEVATDRLETLLSLAPFEKIDSLYRIDLAVRLWWHLSRRAREEIEKEVRFSWGINRSELLQLAKSTPEHLVLIRRALAFDPNALAAFDSALTR